MEAAPEPLQHPAPGERAAGDAVEVLLHRRREAGLHPAAEERLQERGRDPAALGRHEAPVVQDRVAALLQHRDDRHPGRGPADAELVQPAHQPRLGVARRRLRDMALHPHRGRRYGIAFLQYRQGGAVSAGLRHVLAPDPEMAVEDHRRALRRQQEIARRSPGFRGDPDPHPVEPGRRHLARQGAVPDQPVELRRRAVEPPRERLRRPREVGRPDRLVRLLREPRRSALAVPRPVDPRLRRHVGVAELALRATARACATAVFAIAVESVRM